MREGSREFTSRRWLWTIVARFAIVDAVSAAMVTLVGPRLASSDLSGVRGWGFIVASYGAGAIVGGLVMTRYRLRRILAAAMLSEPAYSLLLFALAIPLAVHLDVAAAVLAGGSLEVFNVNSATTMQQEIPADKLSRVASYDALGNYALTPVGTAIAGPLAIAFGTRAILTVGGTLVAVLPVLVLVIPEFRHMRRAA